ncbi:MAG: hypothetical protein ISP90_04755 [Nevskia sp.]|nr:hypothetical protein [Nevskia sp.]
MSQKDVKDSSKGKQGNKGGELRVEDLDKVVGGGVGGHNTQGIGGSHNTNTGGGSHNTNSGGGTHGNH